MIRRLTGTVLEVAPAHVVIDVNGMGYLVFLTPHVCPAVGETCSLFTHLAVRENALDLYGFATAEELSFFELLLTLPKIGPKSALQILSQADLPLLRHAVLSEDHAHLSKMSGISKKTSEKIVLGLKDVLDPVLATAAETPHREHSFASDAIDALVTLGYPQQAAREAIQRLTAEKPEIAQANDAIREALKMLSH
jgi:Holliday junction DNA helicase RuvA